MIDNWLIVNNFHAETRRRKEELSASASLREFEISFNQPNLRYLRSIIKPQSSIYSFTQSLKLEPEL